MKIAFFDTRKYDKVSFDKVNQGKHKITYFEENLTLDNVESAKGFDAVCGFVNTNVQRDILTKLAEIGVKVWLQRSKGYNRIDLEAANELGVHIFRVPDYSKEAVAEHAITLLMSVNRNLKMASRRVSKGNFSIEGLEGREVKDATVGVIGTGKIGSSVIKSLIGLGANVLGVDDFMQKKAPGHAKDIGFKWSTLDEVAEKSDFISVHTPLMESTHHLIDGKFLSKVKDNVVIINTARGPITDTPAIVKALKSGKIRGYGADVLENEGGRFYIDRSKDIDEIKKDKDWKYLLEADNVIITSHQAFLTNVALKDIAERTLLNAEEAEKNDFKNELIKNADGTVTNG